MNHAMWRAHASVYENRRCSRLNSSILHINAGSSTVDSTNSFLLWQKHKSENIFSLLHGSASRYFVDLSLFPSSFSFGSSYSPIRVASASNNVMSTSLPRKRDDNSVSCNCMTTCVLSWYLLKVKVRQKKMMQHLHSLRITKRSLHNRVEFAAEIDVAAKE